MLLEKHLDALATDAIQKALELDAPAPALLRPTQDAKFGDYQLNAAMALGKRLGRPPRELAEIIAAALAGTDAIAKCEVAGPGFVNLTLDPAWVGARLSEALADTERDGVPAIEAPEKIVVDFSSPNIAKQMHVGHLRSTIIGDSIVRMFRFVGHEVIGDNHLGDWGTQFGLLIVGMRAWGSQEALAATPVAELERVYKLASAKAKDDESFADGARAELAKLQTGDGANLALWKSFVSATRKTLDVIYERLDVTFDEWLGESAYEDALPGVVELLLDKGIAREDEGAVCVFFQDQAGKIDKALKKQKSPFIVRKKDGAFLYSTSDIATVQHRRKAFAADRSIYVVGQPQALHFKQLFQVMRLLGEDMRLEHVAFGAVLGDDGKVIRTRSADGKTITLASLLDEAEERAGKRIEEARKEERLRILDEDLEEAIKVIGIGAVKYADLVQNRMTDYKFDWDKMTSFQGNSGPYMQYAYARTRSIFRKGEIEPEGYEAPIRVEAPAEAGLARQLLRFSDTVHRAAETCQPHLICDHLFELSKAFNTFFAECPVLKSEGETRASRLALTALTGRQLRRGLNLLGMRTIERM